MDYRDVEQLLARERGLRARLRGLGRPARLGLAAVLLVVFALSVLLYLPRNDLASFPRVRLLVALGGLTLLALLAVWHALRPLYRPPAPSWVPPTIFAAGVGALGLWAALPEVPTVGVPAPQAHGWMIDCFVRAGIAGLALALLALTLDRGGRSPLEMAAYGAVFGGLGANVGLLLHCPNNDPAHLLFGHGTVPLALAIIIWLLAIGMSAIRRRRATPSPPAPETPSPP